jgi:undecaprenyl pyrophosphate phosphatase UppP
MVSILLIAPLILKYINGLFIPVSSTAQFYAKGALLSRKKMARRNLTASRETDKHPSGA